MKILHVFVDTNIFLQCKPLRDVDWTELGSWDGIDVVLTRPLLDEIDDLKDRGGNERRTARARSTNSLIRELLEANDHRQQIVAKPVVQLCLRYELKEVEPKPSELDYAKRDHKLVGTMLAFCANQPAAEAILLTNDTGPVACAKLMNLPAKFVPASWLLKPEPADTAMQALKSELDRYKDQEPQFEIALSPRPDEGLEVALLAYEELSEKELAVLKAKLAAKFPECNDFGLSEPQERMIERGSQDFESIGSIKEVWRPAPKEEIAQYKAAYKTWWKNCTDQLASLNVLLNARQDWPRVTATIENAGSRPAEDALVVLEVRGNGQLRPPKSEDGEGEKSFAVIGGEMLDLPQPPSPPRGTWIRMDPFSASYGLARSLKDLMGPDFTQLMRGPDRPLMPHITKARDPNSLYFKEGGPGKITPRIAYECSQWRHAQDPEVFEVSLICMPKPGLHTGAIQIQVHAANLTQPQMARLPFKLTLTKASCLEEAKKRIDALKPV
jgi:hypothetical protein